MQARRRRDPVRVGGRPIEHARTAKTIAHHDDLARHPGRIQRREVLTLGNMGVQDDDGENPFDV